MIAAAAAGAAGAGPAMAPPPVVPDWVAAADTPHRRWATTAWCRAAAHPGAVYDSAKAEAAVALWPRVFTLTKDRFTGLPFRLLPWQAAIVRLLVGWKAPTEILDPETGAPVTTMVRLYKRLMLWIPRKNGKTEFLAALALLFFLLDGVRGGEGYAFARNEEQASIVFSKMQQMVGQAPAELRKGVYLFNSRIWVPGLTSRFELLTGKDKGKHGREPSVIVGDEMHEWETRGVEQTLRQGTVSRLQPIELYASTAGLKSAATGVELYEEALAILEGRTEDPTTLVAIFAADPEADWTDEAVWRLANPSLGLSVTLDNLRREAAIAKGHPARENAFKCYHLGIWADEETRWLKLTDWDACAAVDPQAWRTVLERNAGRKCFLAVDAGATRDLTALAYVFPPDRAGDSVEIGWRFWCPADTLAERTREDRAPYDRFARDGALEVTPGNATDQNFVMAAIKEARGRYRLMKFGRDPWNTIKLIADLQRESFPADLIVDMRQGAKTLGEPTKEFERLVLARRLAHGGHPVMRWMVGHALVRFDENLNYVPARKTSREKIDGIIAAVMALGLSMAGAPVQSFWQRG